MADIASLDRHLASLQASPTTIDLLRDLHTQALTEPPYVSTDNQLASVALDRFVALEPDKCALVYLLLRAAGARYVVEAGTSFGVSTIWLALAVGQNAGLQNTDGIVIATENEPTKASRAREHWKRAGKDVEKWIRLKEGDLRETLKTDVPEQIDFLLLDSKLSHDLEPNMFAVHLTQAIRSLVSFGSSHVEGYQDSIEAWGIDCGRQCCL